MVNEQKALVSAAKSSLQLEAGQQKIARMEYEITGQKLEPEEEALVLRQPQLQSARATLQQAETKLALARLNLQRTRIQAPFSGEVVSNSVEVGTRVTSGSELMKLVSTQTFWMELEIPADQVKWLNFASDGGRGSSVNITSSFWGTQFREGEVLSLSPELSRESRMAKVIIAIDDPFSKKKANQGKPKILLNDFLRGSIIGKKIPNASVVPVELVRNSNQIWIFTDQSTLEIRTIEPVYRDSEKVVVISGLEKGENIVRSSIATPVNDLPLRTTVTSQKKGSKKS